MTPIFRMSIRVLPFMPSFPGNLKYVSPFRQYGENQVVELAAHVSKFP